jgi:hypothetical protein
MVKTIDAVRIHTGPLLRARVVLTTEHIAYALVEGPVLGLCQGVPHLSAARVESSAH